MKKQVISVAFACAATLVVATQDARAGSASVARPFVLRIASGRGTANGSMNTAAAQARQLGHLVMDPVAHAAAKRAAASAAAATAAAAPEAAAPMKIVGREGINDNGGTPSDSTGAIGTTRYIETVNSKVAIYNRNLGLISSDTLDNFWNEVGNNNFDPQIMWDARTNRFYYTGDSVASATDNRLAYGFSKTASPNNATTDWCHYELGYGSDFPDYPKLGDSSLFSIIGVNTFSAAGPYIGSDIVAVGKAASAAPIVTCPTPQSLPFTVKRDIKNPGGTRAGTPVPATEVDVNGVGYVIANGNSTSLTIFKVTNSGGTPVIQGTGTSVTVPTYSTPANAPQKNTNAVLDTSDTRLTQAVAANDPNNGGVLALWTQHTVAGGAGAEVRWYEINPATATILQSGKATSASLYYFNGAISPDRVVKGATSAFGGNMVMGFNSSSSTTFPAIRMVSKIGAAAQSAPVVVKNSPGYDADFSCNACRWGDYAAATPDPAASTAGSTGVVWMTSQYTAASAPGDGGAIVWRTWNWSATP